MKVANATLLGMSVAKKNELLFTMGVNFNNLPNWQKRGCGVYWQSEDKPAVNHKTGQAVIARRRQLHHDYDLPMKDAYSAFVLKLLANA